MRLRDYWLGMIAVTAACGTGEQSSPSPEQARIVSSSFPGSVAVGGSLNATLVTSPSTQAIWTSQSPLVATVSGNGRITGISPGIATIRAAVGDTSVSGEVAVFAGMVELSLGGRHACARTASLEVWCWGRDDAGELGRLAQVETCASEGGTFTCSMTPRRNLAALPFTQISAGEFRTCGLTASGEGYCWGFAGAELGPVTETCPAGPCHLTPVKVSGDIHFTWMGAGDDFACGLTASGTVYCMGMNEYGQLGNPTPGQCEGVPCSLVPMQVPGTFTALTVRGLHACALSASGAAFCWGWNAWGQLGNGTISAPLEGSATPVAVAGGHQFVALSAGKQNTCGLDSAGQAWCWGSNEVGQIGDGSPPSGPDPAFSVPRAVSGGKAFVAIAEGLQHSCALSAAGEAYCWGGNQLGQLGDGTTTTRLSPTRVNFGAALTGISTGRNGSCGLTASGKVYCLGTNMYGRLGIGTLTPDHSSVPAGVGGAP